MDATYLVLTAVGPDRPGLVNKIAAAIHAAGANLEDSRMAILGGEFALITLVGGPAAAIDAVVEAAPGLERELGLHVLARPTTRGSGERSFLLYRISVSGLDRPGIVRSISQVLVGHQINVATFASRIAFAPHSGTPMFMLEAEIQIPTATALGALRRALDDACDAENLDFQLSAVR